MAVVIVDVGVVVIEVGIDDDGVVAHGSRPDCFLFCFLVLMFCWWFPTMFRAVKRHIFGELNHRRTKCFHDSAVKLSVSRSVPPFTSVE